MKTAVYCRVSTDREDQANSFAAQKAYFSAYVREQPGWELYDVYADEGITGTSTRKRVQFNRMIRDAFQGRFQLILTKEVSRFSRNILDTLSYTRELKAVGVGVLFLHDGIHSLDPDAELRLSIMASIAQEESRRTSCRVKWGQTRQMEKGVVFGRSMLGYDVSGGKMTINPEGAEVVRLIFQKYGLEKKGTSVIARELREAGCTTCTGKTVWSASHIIKILKNEKYVGDLVQKKTYTPDYLTHQKRYNHGEEELVAIRDHHAPIVDRDLWDRVQAELARRDRRRGSGGSVRYPLSGKILCGVCGSGFVSRRRKRRDGREDRRWGCARAVREGSGGGDGAGTDRGCSIGRLLREDQALDMIRQGLGRLDFDREGVVRSLTDLVLEITEDDGQDAPDRARDLRREIEGLLTGEVESAALYGAVLERITVGPDRHLELRFRGIPQIVHFQG